MAQTITVTGMSCGGCESTVESALEELDGVSAVSADNESDSVTVEGDADTDAIVAAIEDAGYEPAV
ncbi:heavy-metal-associated domain-containing protein [Natronosalvus vescus]|uniref:heavy-metal-associated domain-containing protein n=1 Tax=Natronosalvus vescus TaxID=2953881 RepID=UPI002091994F|nr:heavy metal-associated domain-containing protein [Natronosalvus vescus]